MPPIQQQNDESARQRIFIPGAVDFQCNASSFFFVFVCLGAVVIPPPLLIDECGFCVFALRCCLAVSKVKCVIHHNVMHETIDIQ